MIVLLYMLFFKSYCDDEIENRILEVVESPLAKILHKWTEFSPRDEEAGRPRTNTFCYIPQMNRFYRCCGITFQNCLMVTLLSFSHLWGEEYIRWILWQCFSLSHWWLCSTNMSVWIYIILLSTEFLGWSTIVVQNLCSVYRAVLFVSN